MEPASIPATKKGRGSIEDPEVLENVPGHIIPVLEREFDDFDTTAAKFMRGEMEEPEFIGFRLKQGVYGQRQPDVQMIRVKLPMGGVTPEQLETFADVIEDYAPLNKGHITTRQNIQIHHVPLPDAAQLIRRISDSGLSSREGCGNTVRNVTGDPFAGVSTDELFDLTPYAGAYVRYFVRHPTTQLMPRKIKTAFESAPESDRSLTGIHDIAFIARERDGERGVEVRRGRRHVDHAARRADALRLRRAGRRRVPRGRRGRLPHLRPPGLAAREPRACPHQGARRQDRHRRDAPARGRGASRATGSPSASSTSRACAWTWTRRSARRGSRPCTRRPTATARSSSASAPPTSPRSARPASPPVQVHVPRGDLSPEQLRALADIARRYSGGWVRTTVHQNLVLRWVRDETVYEVWQALDDLGLGEAGADEINDVVSCPGTDSCKLGITSSMGLNAAIRERIAAMGITDPLTRRIHVKMSGCPNGCSQHHIANIGFYGASIRAGDHTIPAYVAHIGGNYEGGDIVYGQRLKVRLPAKRAPEAVERWIRLYEAGREDGEVFNDFAARVGAQAFEDEVRDLGMPVEFGLETMDQFIDWTKNAPFVVQRGEGECAV